ncbi:glycosyltransferase [Latilactobacillus curvatus]
MQKKKLLVVGDFRPGSGLTEYIFETFTRLDDKFIIDVIRYGGKDDLNQKLKTLSWGNYKVTSVHDSIFKHLIDWIHVLKMCKKEQYDVVHFNYSSSWNFFPVILTKIILRTKIVIHSHSSYYSNTTNSKLKLSILNILNSLGRIIFNYSADEKIATSEKAADWMFGKNKDVEIITNGIDLGKYTYSTKTRFNIRESKGIEIDTVVLGFVGALRKLKNPHYLIDVFEEYKKINNNSILLIAGDGPMRAELERRIEERKSLNNAVIFMGVINNVADVLQAMDYFVFPSQNEGYGLVLAEAEAAGLHSITTNKVPDAVIISELTRVVPLEKGAKYWAEIINSDIDYERKSEFKRMSDSGFDIMDSVEKLQSVYRRINNENKS